MVHGTRTHECFLKYEWVMAQSRIHHVSRTNASYHAHRYVAKYFAHSYICHDSFTFVTLSYMWRDSFEWIMRMRHVPHTDMSQLNASNTRAMRIACNMQHTATHCDTLQHTAPHCNTLHHTATHRSHFLTYDWVGKRKRLTMTVSIANAISPKSTKSRNQIPQYLAVQYQIESVV